jgi:hypothetical protein
MFQTSKRNLKKLVLAGSALSGLIAMNAAHAAIDISGATTGITEAQTAILAIIGALLAMSVAIFGIVKVYAFISRKAGA